MNKRLLVLSVLVTLLTITLSACAQPEATPVLATATKGAPLYKVTKSTGLYDAADIDAGLIAELPIGTLLKPANDEMFYDCETLVEAGTTYVLCLVEVINTGETGWVLQKWTERE